MKRIIALALLLTCFGAGSLCASDAELILHNGKIITVDKQFSVHHAIAVAGGRIMAVGNDAGVLKFKGAATEVVDLKRRTVLPGLMDSHVHPTGACMTEFDHPIPDFECIADVLEYFKARTKAVKEGEWIWLDQVFITRLRERRYPTREELDRVAPAHPAIFRTGPDASLNSLALRLSSIDRDFKVADGGPGFAEKDPKTGEPTGILRNCTRYVKMKSSAKSATEEQQLARLTELLRDYASVGLTAICDRDCSAGALAKYEKLREQGKLPLRVRANHGVSYVGETAALQKKIRDVAEHPLFKQREGLVRIIGMKTYLDGGMLTGSAYLRQPWGVSQLYAITDPQYRGVKFVEQEKLVAMIRTSVECGMQFTAHSVGDGAVHAMLDAYEEVNKTVPIRATRPSISHSNFMSREAVEQAARLGVAVDIQPAWLYLDTRTLVGHFGYDRMRYFQPLRSIFEAGGIAGGGSDHMQKIGSLRSNNPYDPFLGIWTTITRKARWYDGQLHPEEALSREQAIRFYTINNARILFLDDQCGSIESGKRADLIVLDTDILTCPVDDIRKTRVLVTYLDGKPVFSRK